MKVILYRYLADIQLPFKKKEKKETSKNNTWQWGQYDTVPFPVRHRRHVRLLAAVRKQSVPICLNLRFYYS